MLFQHKKKELKCKTNIFVESCSYIFSVDFHSFKPFFIHFMLLHYMVLNVIIAVGPTQQQRARKKAFRRTEKMFSFVCLLSFFVYLSYWYAVNYITSKRMLRLITDDNHFIGILESLLFLSKMFMSNNGAYTIFCQVYLKSINNIINSHLKHTQNTFKIHKFICFNTSIPIFMEKWSERERPSAAFLHHLSNRKFGF